jgi:26S proteasome regulatory subunit N6
LERIMSLLYSCNEYFSKIPKARTAKIVRNILNIVSSVEGTLDIQIRLCEDIIAWCKSEKRTFLRQRIEARVRYLDEGIRRAALNLVVVSACWALPAKAVARKGP